MVEARAGYWRFQPVAWDDVYEYLPGATCLEQGKPCLFPEEGFILMRGWRQQPMACVVLPGGGEELFCARPRRQVAGLRRQGGDEAAGSANESNATTDATRALVVRCPIGACAANNTCLQNRTGPACGFCKPG